MGLSCGTIFVRDSHLAAVVSACADLAREAATRFLVAPSEREWIAVYPSGAGQDPAASAALAARLGGRVLHLLLHDSDVVYYLYFRAGVRIDTFCSIPDYFGDVSAEEANAQRGRAELLADLLPPATSVAGLESRLAELRDTASDRAEAFRGDVDFERLGQALGVPLTMRSYEDLQDGPARGRLGMQHLPDPAAERAVKRLEKSRIKAELTTLQERGALLLALSRKSSRKRDDFHPSPVFTADPAGGILLSWSDHALRSAESLPVVRLDARWQGPPTPTRINLGAHLYTMAVSSDSDSLAAGYASGRWEIELWDFASGRLRWKVPVERAGRVLAFAPDDDLLAVESEQRLHLLEVSTGARQRTFELERGESFAAFHPGGRHLVYVRFPDLVIFDLQEGREITALRSAEASLAEWESAVQRGESTTAFHAHEVASSATFSEDGGRLAVATHAGPRVYRWADLLVASGRFPDPLCAASSKLVQLGEYSREQGTHCVVFDSLDRLFYCGLEGEIGVLEPDPDAPARTLAVPGAPPLFRAARTGDGQAFVVVAQPGMFERQRPPAELQIWSFDGIARAAVQRA